MGKGTRWRRRATRIGSVFALVGALASVAVAQEDVGTYTAVLTPSSATVSTATDFDLTVTNTSTTSQLGGLRITMPRGFSGASDVSVDRTGWSIGGSSRIRIVADADSRLEPGEAMTVSFTATTSRQGDNHTFGLEAGATRSFSQNLLALDGATPAVEVSGSVVSCRAGRTCQATVSEGNTTVTVTSGCEAGIDCGSLVTDVIDYCPIGSCVGNAIFWVPPAGATEYVQILMKIQADPYYLPAFYVSPTDSDEVVACTPEWLYGGYGGGYEELAIDCSYDVWEEGGFVYIKALVEPVDPRGFAS